MQRDFLERMPVTPSTRDDAGCFIVMIILCSRGGIRFLSFRVMNGNGESRFHRNANVKRGCREFSHAMLREKEEKSNWF